MSRRHRSNRPICPVCQTQSAHKMRGDWNLWWCDDCHEYFPNLPTTVAKATQLRLALEENFYDS